MPSGGRQPKSATGARFFLGPPEHPCTCDLGGDRIDEQEAKLGFAPSAVGKIKKTLRSLLSQAGPAGLELRACYSTHEQTPPLGHVRATLGEPLDLILRDRLEGNVRYRVTRVKS